MKRLSILSSVCPVKPSNYSMTGELNPALEAVIPTSTEVISYDQSNNEVPLGPFENTIKASGTLVCQRTSVSGSTGTSGTYAPGSCVVILVATRVSGLIVFRAYLVLALVPGHRESAPLLRGQ
jgi:hypothetical protein